MPEAEAPRDAPSLVAALKRGGLLDALSESAFLEVPRAAFLPGLPPEEVYKDEAVPIKIDEDGTVLSSSSQPSMMALMLHQLQLTPGLNVLEIGTGTGYNAALIQHMVGDEGKVTSLEIDPQVVETARENLQRASSGSVLVVHGDGAVGYVPRASYDRIIATAGIWDVPQAWVRQLKPRGILVAPIWIEGFQISAAFTLQPDGSLSSAENYLCGFIHLRGQAAGPDLGVRVGTTGLYIYAGTKIDTTALHMLLSDDAEDAYLGAALDITEYWQGFLPYLVLHVPETFILARYQVTKDAPAYGITGGGFVLLTQGSACFVSLSARGTARNFGSADALLEVQQALTDWDQAGRPQQNHLRLRLIPQANSSFTVKPGKVYPRRDHYLVAWMETETTGNGGKS